MLTFCCMECCSRNAASTLEKKTCRQSAGSGVAPADFTRVGDPSLLFRMTDPKSSLQLRHRCRFGPRSPRHVTGKPPNHVGTTRVPFWEVAPLSLAADSEWMPQYSQTCPLAEHPQSTHTREVILVESLPQGGSTMFEKIFERSDALRHQLAGPLREARLAYLHHRAKQGAPRSTLRKLAQYLLVVAELCS